MYEYLKPIDEIIQMIKCLNTKVIKINFNYKNKLSLSTIN